ncbi:hypothetical protein FB451DRAFT_1390276 [Mycena latifolia]|nr:hypothetical protein FB451DRAFT_1390276 [Mycena latifolia]
MDPADRRVCPVSGTASPAITQPHAARPETPADARFVVGRRVGIPRARRPAGLILTLLVATSTDAPQLPDVGFVSREVESRSSGPGLTGSIARTRTSVVESVLFFCLDRLLDLATFSLALMHARAQSPVHHSFSGLSASASNSGGSSSIACCGRKARVRPRDARWDGICAHYAQPNRHNPAGHFFPGWRTSPRSDPSSPPRVSRQPDLQLLLPRSVGSAVLHLEQRGSDAIEVIWKPSATGFGVMGGGSSPLAGISLDGMGHSGSCMMFFWSDSVPVKATVNDEYFTGWIELWWVAFCFALFSSYTSSIDGVMALAFSVSPSRLVNYLSAAYAKIYNIFTSLSPRRRWPTSPPQSLRVQYAPLQS